MKNTTEEDEPEIQDNGAKSVGVKARRWICGFVNEMRRKSPASVQKWVDSLATDENTCSDNDNQDNSNQLLKLLDKSVCDKNELKSAEEESSSSAINENLKVKINLLKIKGQEIKSLLTKAPFKIKDKLLESSPEDHCEMEHIKTDNLLKNESETTAESKKEMSTLAVHQRCHIKFIGRSSSENPNPNRQRLNQIGRSFSVAHDNENSIENISDNLIYDVDEDISTFNTIPSINTSSKSIYTNTSNSQLDRNLNIPGPSSTHNKNFTREHTVSEGHQSPRVPHKNPLLRDISFQSDSSHCSSVESLLEARKPDAEAILLNLGFGPAQGSDDILAKIPKRFLKPSQVRGNDTQVFLKSQQLATQIHENSVLGYRGLLGNPHCEPSDIVRAIIERFSKNEIHRMESMESLNNNCHTQPKSFKGVANTVLAQRQFMK